MRQYIAFIGLTSLCSAGVIPNTVSPSVITRTPGCLQNGKMYKEGEKVSENPCMPCFCSHGRMACMIIDCMRPNCIDSVRGKNDCCAVCPNGPNCLLPDGSILKGYDKKTLDDGRECKCSKLFGMGFTPGNVNATCIEFPKKNGY